MGFDMFKFPNLTSTSHITIYVCMHLWMWISYISLNSDIYVTKVHFFVLIKEQIFKFFSFFSFQSWYRLSYYFPKALLKHVLLILCYQLYQPIIEDERDIFWHCYAYWRKIYNIQESIIAHVYIHLRCNTRFVDHMNKDFFTDLQTHYWCALYYY